MADADQARCAVQGDLGLAERTGWTKPCTNCKEVKPLDKFHRNRAAADGHEWACMECRNRSERTRRGLNPERHRLRNKQYRKANPHIVWQNEYRTRCSFYGLTPAIVPFTRAQLVERWGERCVYCTVGAFEQVDHLLPIAAGGPHTLANVVPACGRCNQAKLRMFDWPAIREFRNLAVGAPGARIPDLAAIRLALGNVWQR